ncbi:MAG: signal peptidase II [Acidimicrobiales bacterium]
MSSSMSVRRLGAHSVGVVVCALVAIADQLSKNWAVESLAKRPIHLVGPFQFALEFNPGFAFSLGTRFPTEITIVAIAAVAALLVGSILSKELVMRVGLALIAGGALGNVLDRLFRPYGGSVVDFIYSGFWPTFNLADSAIVIGALVIGVAGVRRYRHSE